MTETEASNIPLRTLAQEAPDTQTHEPLQEAPICPPHTTQRRLILKLDSRLLPILFLIYFLAFLDRVNISNALTLGLPQELGLNDVTDQQSNIALAIFFVPYITLEIPSNWLMKRFKPHVWLSGCVVIFGAVMLAQGFVKSYGGLLATRFLLGAAEAGIFPGCFYLISFHYKRTESQQRFTWFWTSTGLAGAFGSLIASGIAMMQNARGLSSWRWIFIIEGAITIVCGILSYFVILDFPGSSSWLRDDEREYIMAWASLYRDVDREPITLKGVGQFFKDGKKVMGGIMYFAALIPLYSFTYFVPTIVRTLNLPSTVLVQLYSVPPWACAVFYSIGVSYLSDRLQKRLPFLMLSSLIGITGLGMLQGLHTGFGARYAALCLVLMGTYASGPLIVCWATMNLRGHLDRAVGTAWIIGFGNIGGIIATFTLPMRDAPVFRNGYAICQAGACLGFVTFVVYYFMCKRANKRMKAQCSKDLYML